MNQRTRLIRKQVREALDALREHGFDRIERSQLAAREFAALLPLAYASGPQADEALSAALGDFKSARARVLDQIPGLHSLRIMAFDDRDKRARLASAGGPVPVSGPLLFAFVCDGNVLDVLEELLHGAGAVLDAVLAHCAGYPGTDDARAWVQYCVGYRIRSPYFFRDSRVHDPFAQPLSASAREIGLALRTRQRVYEIVTAANGADRLTGSASIAQRLRALRKRQAGGDPGIAYPFDLDGALERPFEHEGLWVRRFAELTRARARRDARERPDVRLRAVHAKHYGFIRATLEVAHDVPEHLQQGVFQPGRRYDARIRVSSSAPRQSPDWVPDAHGMSIKLLNVQGEPALKGHQIPDGIPGLDLGLTQDFLLVTHPRFFLTHIRDFVILRSLLDARPLEAAERAELALAAGVFVARRPRELTIFARTLLRVIRHPLAADYFSMAPFSCGPNRAVAFSCGPSAATRRRLAGGSWSELVRDLMAGPNDYLRAALERTLAGAPLELELAVHSWPVNAPSVEDGLADWTASGSMRTVVARLRIEAQDATSKERLRQAERVIMTPWHALAAHRPLGNLNRARLAAYRASSEERNPRALHIAGDAVDDAAQ